MVEDGRFRGLCFGERRSLLCARFEGSGGEGVGKGFCGGLGLGKCFEWQGRLGKTARKWPLLGEMW